MNEEDKRFNRKELIRRFSEKTQSFAKEHTSIINLKAVLTGFAALIVISGLVLVVGQGTGYTVYYGDKALGFVSNPGEILGNISNINNSISEEVKAEAMVDEAEFSFERSVKLFSAKDEWTEIADEANENCDIDVNVYDIYVDGDLIAQDSSLDGVVSAMSQIKEEYVAENPDDSCDNIDFDEVVEINVTKAEEVETAEQEELYEALNDCLTVRTLSYEDEVKTIEFNTVYEKSEDVPEGVQKVKQEGKKGAIKVTTKIERVNGEVVSKQLVKRVIEKEAQDKIIVINPKSPVAANESGFINPTTGLLTSKMGTRWGRTHKGIDIANSVGTPIYAALGGTVEAAENKNNGYGNMIKINHGNGLYTLYAHLSGFNCKIGQKVEQGDLIGAMGSTGRSTGSHLHFEVIQDGVNLDPLLYVKYE